MDNCQKREQKVLKRARDLLENSRWNDCHFLVGSPPTEEVVGAQRVFLAMASPVFETMFFENTPEENNSIEIPEIQAESFRALLKFIYIDELVLDRFEIVWDLYYCAKKYMLQELAEKCEICIQSILSAETVCKIYELSEFVGESKLKEQCLKLMQTETKKILSKKSWEDAQMATVSVLFQQEVLAVDSEIELYDALLRWARAESRRKGFLDDQQSLRTVAGELVTKIRFLTLTSTQFAEGPGKGEILDKDENFALLMRISSPKVSIPMPQGFSEDKNDRLNPHKKLELATVKRELMPTDDVLRGPKRIRLNSNSDEKVNSTTLNEELILEDDFSQDSQQKVELDLLSFLSRSDHDDDDNDDPAEDQQNSEEMDSEYIIDDCALEKEMTLKGQRNAEKEKGPQIRKVEIFHSQTCESGSSMIASIASTSQDIDNDTDETQINNDDLDDKLSYEEMAKLVKKYEKKIEKLKERCAEKDRKLEQMQKKNDLQRMADGLRNFNDEEIEEKTIERERRLIKIPKPKEGETKTLFMGRSWHYEHLVKAAAAKNINSRITSLMHALWPDKANRIKLVMKKKKSYKEDLMELSQTDLIAIRDAAKSLGEIKYNYAKPKYELSYFKKVISNTLKCERMRYKKVCQMKTLEGYVAENLRFISSQSPNDRERKNKTNGKKHLRT